VEDVTPFKVPSPAEFGGRDWLQDARLDALGARLIQEHISFDHLASLDIDYLWKRKGGNSQGKATLGQCAKPGSRERYYGAGHFVVWIAADYVRDLGMTERQVEALLYHELCHAGMDIEKGTLTIWPHDFEGFTDELKHYGTWQTDLKLAKRAFDNVEQPGLFDQADANDGAEVSN
jgi:hypothetical protein